MRSVYTQLYLHLVWATWGRHPLITPELKPRIYAILASQTSRLGGDVLAIGGTSDHVHELLRFPTTVTVSELVGRLKGASSHFVAQVLRSETPFKWQGGYGAFTVSKAVVPRVSDYIRNQEQHHRDGTLSRELERIDRAVEASRGLRGFPSS